MSSVCFVRFPRALTACTSWVWASYSRWSSAQVGGTMHHSGVGYAARNRDSRMHNFFLSHMRSILRANRLRLSRGPTFR